MRYSIPNILSLARIVLAPLIYQMIITFRPEIIVIACILFIIGALTDYFDGVLARKWGESSSFGSFFDPLADKILTSAAFFAFATISIIPLWMVMIVVVRDIITTALRMYADAYGKQIRTSRSAKFKTFIQLVYIIVILLFLSFAPYNFSFMPKSIYLIEYWGMALITVLTIYSTIEYFIDNKLLLQYLKQEKKVEILYITVASFFGTGFSSVAPGTVASLFSMIIIFFNLNTLGYLLVLIPLIILSIPAVEYLETKYGSDSPIIVIDEVIGMWLLLSLPIIPKSFIWNFAALLLFRFFDIIKPYPINLVNDRKGAIWVILDDIVAAVMSAIILYAAYLFNIASKLVFMR